MKKLIEVIDKRRFFLLVLILLIMTTFALANIVYHIQNKIFSEETKVDFVAKEEIQNLSYVNESTCYEIIRFNRSLPTVLKTASDNDIAKESDTPEEPTEESDYSEHLEIIVLGIAMLIGSFEFYLMFLKM